MFEAFYSISISSMVKKCCDIYEWKSHMTESSIVAFFIFLTICHIVHMLQCTTATARHIVRSHRSKYLIVCASVHQCSTDHNVAHPFLSNHSIARDRTHNINKKLFGWKEEYLFHSCPFQLLQLLRLFEQEPSGDQQAQKSSSFKRKQTRTRQRTDLLVYFGWMV